MRTSEDKLRTKISVTATFLCALGIVVVFLLFASEADAATVKVLVVGGGGGAGGRVAGGGGAGGFIYDAAFTVTAQAYSVTVGAGGAGGGDGINGTSGGNSVFSTYTAVGGGGSFNDGQGNPGANGGSGSGDRFIGGSGTAGQGNAGGGGPGNVPNYGEGGGGGAGATGAAGTTVIGGNGGGGISNLISGSAATYAGGGGGGILTGTPGSGGAGGGGAGSNASPGGNAVPNTGGGGGGGGDNPGAGGNGGSGIVVISFPIDGSTGVSTSSTGGTITTVGGNQIHTFTSSGTFTVVAVAAAPTITTPTATSISSNGATLGANVTSDGGASLTARGTCWGTAPAPTTNCLAEGGTTTGVFTHARTGMSPNVLIYYRGYATNSVGTGYSADGSFTTGNTNISSTDKWAWNDVTGWINFYSTNAVKVTDTKIQGYAVFESSPGSYVSLDCATGPTGSDCGNSYFVSNDGNGKLAGWGWSDVYGWISFCGNATGGSTWNGSAWVCPGSPTYQVMVSPTGTNAGDFSGWAWNDIYGWISFCGNATGGSTWNGSAWVCPGSTTYKVNTSWRNGPVVSGSLISSTFDTSYPDGVAYNSITWKGNPGTGGSVKFQLATSNSSIGVPDGGLIGPVDSVDRYAWNDIIGWLDFYGAPGGPATVASIKMTRWATSSDGDFALDCATTPSGDICATSNFYVSNSNGNLAGFAWNDIYGWTSFCGGQGTTNCPGAVVYQATINQTTGEFHGWAWNDIIGWISFNCAEAGAGACAGSNYKVKIAGGGAGSQWSFIGPDGSPGSKYVTTGPDAPVPIVTAQHNNKRYYRYKVYLEFQEKMVGDTKPVVDEVIVNWSP